MPDNSQETITVFAKTNFRNKEVPFGIKTDDRRRHMYLIGKTGMGKTTVMENMVIQDIRNGHGVAFLDPHGDSVQRILNSVPSSRVNDVVYFNPADLEYPIAFNILEAVETKYKHLVASGLMGVFTKIWANLWSARMEYILNNTILALLDSPGNTLLGITRMYVDKKYRKRIVDNVKDPMVRAFWVDEFANYNEKYRTEAIAPIQNKVGQFLSSGIIRNIVGQPKSTIDLRDIMDNRKILIMDLSKGKVGEDNSALLGAMIVTKLQLAALSRADIPENERKDFYLYVDEFQNFATESFATILSEARKYRLNLIVGHQYMGQLVQDRNTKVKDAILGNVGTLVVFRIGAEDAESLAKEFEPVFTEVDMVNLPKYHIILKLMINGVASEPFSAVTVPPSPEFFTGNSEKVIKVSRERHSNPASEVEEKISRWMGAEFHQESAVLLGENGRQNAGSEPEGEPEAALPAPETLRPPAPKPAPAFPLTEPKAPVQTLNSEPEMKQAEPNTGQKSAARLPVSSSGPDASAQAAPFVPKRDDRPAGDKKRIQHKQHSRENIFHQKNNFPSPNKAKFSGKPSGPQKKENPIWNTVASLRQDKNLAESEKVSSVIDSLLSGRIQEEGSQLPQPAWKSERQEQQIDRPDAEDSDKKAGAETIEKKILKPGQSFKLD